MARRTGAVATTTVTRGGKVVSTQTFASETADPMTVQVIKNQAALPTDGGFTVARVQGVLMTPGPLNIPVVAWAALAGAVTWMAA